MRSWNLIESVSEDFPSYSSLHSFTEIFDEKFHHSKYGKKENWTNTGKNKQEKAGLQSHNTACHHQSVYQI